MPSMETFKEMGVNFDKFEEYDIEKMKCRGEGMYYRVRQIWKILEFQNSVSLT